jgi:hypothetical protein
MNVIFEDIVKLAEQLTPKEQNLLIYRLRIKQISAAQVETQHNEIENSPARDELIRDVQMLRQTPVNPADTLLGKYARPEMAELSEEEFHAAMHSIATEWEQELDEFHNSES